MGDFQPGEASLTRQDGFSAAPGKAHAHRGADAPSLKLLSRPGPRVAWQGPKSQDIQFIYFFPRLEKRCRYILHLSCRRSMPFLPDWHKYKVHVCHIYLLRQRWAAPLEMLTRNKVHCSLSGHRMFPPQSREHLLAYLLGEAWHSAAGLQHCETQGGRRRGGGLGLPLKRGGCSPPRDALGVPGHPKAPGSTVTST